MRSKKVFLVSETDDELKMVRKHFLRNFNAKPSGPAKNVPRRLQVNANDEGAQMSGYLHKQIGNRKFKKMWFVLKDHVLYAYKASEDVAATQTYPILGFDLEIVSSVRVIKHKHCHVCF